MDMLRANVELKDNLSAVAHLIHGSSEGRFKVTYCTRPAHGGLTKEEVEGVGYSFMDYDDAVCTHTHARTQADTHMHAQSTHTKSAHTTFQSRLKQAGLHRLVALFTIIQDNTA